MKILIGNDGYTAFYHIRTGLAKVFSACGHKVALWDIDKKPVFDAFDEFEPDIFLFQTYNLTPSVVKCIEERPHLKCVMKAGDWGDFYKHSDMSKYGVLQASQKEIDFTLKLKEETNQPIYVDVHYHPDWIGATHENWI